MSEQDNFDDLLRSKFSEEGDFPFDEENWTKAEKLIEASRKKEKRRRWFIIFFSGILLGIFVTIPFILDKGEKPIPSFNIDQKPTAANQSKANLEQTTPAADKTGSGNVSGNVSASNENHSATSAKQKVFVSESDFRTKKHSTDSSPVNKPQITTRSAEPVLLSGPRAKKTNAQLKEPPIIEIPETKKKKDTKTSNFVVGNKPDARSEEKTISLDKKNVKQEQMASQSKSANQENTEEKKATSGHESKTGVPADVSLTSKDTTQAVTTDTKPVTAAVKKDSVVQPANLATSEKKDSIPAKSAWSIYADAGINAFVAGGNGVSPFAGLNITYAFNPHWEIGTGIYYTYLPCHSGIATFTTSASYDFGSTMKLTEIVTEKLHYAVAPLFAKFNFNDKNALLLGANFFYLFNSSNVITTYELTYSGIQNRTSTRTSGYYNGFSPYDVGILAGYKKAFTQKLGVGLYLNCGLVYLQKTGYYGDINIGPRNISGQLVLTYKLFK